MHRAKSYDSYQPGGNDHFDKEEWHQFRRQSSHHNVFKHFMTGISSKNPGQDIAKAEKEADSMDKANVGTKNQNKEDMPETNRRNNQNKEHKQKQPHHLSPLSNTSTTTPTSATTKAAIEKKYSSGKIIEKESLEDSEFNHIFVTPNHYGNETGDVAAAEFYERPTFLKTLRSTDEATLRREVPVATWVRNSTILTRNYHKLGNQINPYQLFQSVSRRQKLLQAADKFNTFKKYDAKSRHKLINKRRMFDQTLDATIREIEQETFTLSRGERQSAFPQDFAFPYIGAPKKPRSLVGKKKKKRRRRHRHYRKGKHHQRVDLTASYEIRHSSSRKALKSLQQDLLNKIVIEKYGENAIVSDGTSSKISNNTADTNEQNKKEEFISPQK